MGVVSKSKHALLPGAVLPVPPIRRNFQPPTFPYDPELYLCPEPELQGNPRLPDIVWRAHSHMQVVWQASLVAR